MFHHKIAILGSTGYVGSHFLRLLKEQGVETLTPTRQDIDFNNIFQLSEYLFDNKVTFLVNCIGYTGKPNVDACEYNKEECLLVNALLPTKISLACELANINWGHVSSGCIYNYYNKDYTEEDELNFSFGNRCSYYSGTKALAESFLKIDKRCYVWRLRVPFSNVDSNRNYISKLLKYNKLNWCLNSLTDIDEFCKACLQCITHTLPFGVYNLTNPGHMAAREVVTCVYEILGINHVYTEHNPDELHPIVPRSNCILNVDKAMKYGIHMSPVKQAVQNALLNWTK